MIFRSRQAWRPGRTTGQSPCPGWRARPGCRPATPDTTRCPAYPRPECRYGRCGGGRRRSCSRTCSAPARRCRADSPDCQSAAGWRRRWGWTWRCGEQKSPPGQQTMSDSRPIFGVAKPAARACSHSANKSVSPHIGQNQVLLVRHAQLAKSCRRRPSHPRRPAVRRWRRPAARRWPSATGVTAR